MTRGEDWDRVQDLFHVASELSTTSRSEYLDEIEADDPQIAAELRSLLEAHDGEGVLDAPLPDLKELGGG